MLNARAQLNPDPVESKIKQTSLFVFVTNFFLFAHLNPNPLECRTQLCNETLNIFLPTGTHTERQG